ncbi:hypothetical protein [Desulfosporosinus sp. Sb-LF]|nr:hypothetical protein [Desulfosporosinus sp. Sb-LF]
MFDADKKEKALTALTELCHHCGDQHSDECPLAKAMVAVKAIPTA